MRPSTPERMRYISGVGDVKLRDFAGRFLPLIASHSREHGLALDVNAPVRPIGTVMAPKPAARTTVRTQAAHDLYRKGASIDDVMRELKYARTTAVEHLAEFIRTAKPASIATWVSEDVVQRVTEAARRSASSGSSRFFSSSAKRSPTTTSGWCWRICKRGRASGRREPADEASSAGSRRPLAGVEKPLSTPIRPWRYPLRRVAVRSGQGGPQLMAQKEEDIGKKKGGGWFKALLGTLGGLLSGVVVMYFSAFVDRAVKPAKPVPNFRVEHDGRVVHFQNLSPGFTGWWDFGDGSEMVPADADHLSIDHTYERPGDYSIKLSLSNLLGEESDRTVSLHVEDAARQQTAQGGQPGGGSRQPWDRNPGPVQGDGQDDERLALLLGRQRRPPARVR